MVFDTDTICLVDPIRDALLTLINNLNNHYVPSFKCKVSPPIGKSRPILSLVYEIMTVTGKH